MKIALDCTQLGASARRIAIRMILPVQRCSRVSLSGHDHLLFACFTCRCPAFHWTPAAWPGISSFSASGFEIHG